MKEIIIHAILGILGVVTHSLLKYNTLKKSATAGNVAFSFIKYIGNDAAGIILSIISVGIWLFLFDEASEHYPAIKGYTRASFVIMGFFGSYIIQYTSSVAEKKITGIIDEKTNKLDGSNAPCTDLNSKG